MKKIAPTLQTKYIFIIIALLVVGVGLVFLTPRPTEEVISQVETGELKRYDANGLGISIDIKKGAVIDDRPNLLVLYYGDNKISGNRIATDFETIEEYLIDLSEKNNWGEFQQQPIAFNGNQAVYVTRKNGESEKDIYFIKKGDWVYSFTASTPELEGDLEMILKTIVFKD